jgi:hypothetical protein
MISLPLNVGFSALAAGRPDSVSGISSVRTGMRLRWAFASVAAASAASSIRPYSARFTGLCDAIWEATIPPLCGPHIG